MVKEEKLMELAKLIRSAPMKAGFLITCRVVLAMSVVWAGLSASQVIAAEKATGKIYGKVIDVQTGEPLIGVTLMIKGTVMGTRSDVDGKYTIKNVPPGTYEVAVSSIGYGGTVITEVIVSGDEPTSLDVLLVPEAVQIEGIKVTAKAMQNSEASMLAKRSNSATVSDAISAEDISRSGSGNAAEAMSKITGASVIGGKYIYIRGLGDRYANTNLNGSPLPSPDLDKQGVPMDLIPSSLLDNIVIEKTFTPDKAGDFAGGSADLATKDYPTERTLTLTLGSSYNSITTGNTGFLTQDGSSSNWLGYDNGSLDVPAYIENHPDLQEQASKNPGFIDVTDGDPENMHLAYYMDTASRSFSTEMVPRTRKAPVDQSYALSYGDEMTLGNRPLGIVAGLSYSHKYRMYQNGFDGDYKAGGTHPVQYTVSHELSDSKSTDEVLWGGLTTLNYSMSQNNKLGASFIYTRNGTTEDRLLEGISPEYSEPGAIYRARTLGYTERNLYVMQVNGTHVGLPAPGGQVRINWQASFSKTNQNEPDWRSSSDEVTQHLVEDPETGDLVWDGTYDYVINPSRYEKPIRIWRNTDETNKEFKADFTVPIDRSTRYKTGFAYVDKDRSHRERRFIYAITDRYKSYAGDVDSFFSVVGMRGGSFTRTYQFNGVTHYQFAYDNFLREDVELRNQYDGSQNVVGIYQMIEMPVIGRLNFVGGARYEATDMTSESQDNNYDIGRINEAHWLPSANLIFRAGQAINIRTSYGKTLARPTLREMSPHYLEPFGLGRKTSGNADLKLTLIDNYDLRCEWFMRPGEVAAVSGFYKEFTNPIEMGFHGTNGGIQPQNADRGRLWGMEFEVRSHLDRVWDKIGNFAVGGNLTLVHSEVSIPEEEMAQERWYDPNASSTRPMWGQSPYIVNADISYENERTSTSMSLFYNVFGKRMAFNAEFPTGDVYEQPRHQIDLLLAQQLFGGPTLRFGAKNLLNENAKFVHERLGTPEDNADGERIYKEYDIGVTYSVSVGYQVW